MKHEGLSFGQDNKGLFGSPVNSHNFLERPCFEIGASSSIVKRHV